MKNRSKKNRSKRAKKDYRLIMPGDTNSFLLIVAGGIFIIASFFFFLGNPFM